MVYTMGQIKNFVDDLRYKALRAYDEKIDREFGEEIVTDPEIMADITAFENLMGEAENLYDKHYDKKINRYRAGFPTGGLKTLLKDQYEKSRESERDKIRAQFKAIQNTLSAMRSPKKALEYLKTCGIELPEQVNDKPVNVDPDFIRSVLPTRDTTE